MDTERVWIIYLITDSMRIQFLLILLFNRKKIWEANCPKLKSQIYEQGKGIRFQLKHSPLPETWCRGPLWDQRYKNHTRISNYEVHGVNDSEGGLVIQIFEVSNHLLNLQGFQKLRFPKTITKNISENVAF